MGLKYLAVDNDIELANSEAAGWAKRGITMERVDSMSVGIHKLSSKSNDYLYVGINDATVDFLPLLDIMRSVTNIPILIATKNYATEKEVAALRNGADLFATFQKDAKGNISNEGNINSVLAHITRKTERTKMPAKILFYNNVLITPVYRRVFVKDTEVDLTKKEFALLHYLMVNNGRVLSHAQILGKVWGDEYSDNGSELLWRTMERLRRKLIEVSADSEYIKAEREVGYKFSS